MSGVELDAKEAARREELAASGAGQRVGYRKLQALNRIARRAVLCDQRAALLYKGAQTLGPRVAESARVLLGIA